MATKKYQWGEGATLAPHSERKHKILRQYFFQYLLVRCQLPQRERFRLAVVDGFSGAGRYGDGSPGSPIIFIEELKRASEAVNLKRAIDGLGAVDIECFLLFNDANQEAVQLLEKNCAPLLGGIRETVPHLHIQVEYLANKFEQAQPLIKQLLQRGRYRNIIYNLDQCGHSHVTHATLSEIMCSAPSVEIFHTFAIETLVSFLNKKNKEALARQLQHLDIDIDDLTKTDGGLSRQSWLGTAEKIVFEKFRGCAPYVSPFSIHNPQGWRYWLIHFANSYRARQVYNDILHENSSSQAHFGRSGLNMLSYNPAHEEGSLYLFDSDGRMGAKDQLLNDIPKFIAESGDTLAVGDFYESIYNTTPAHKDDIHAAIIESTEIEVITPAGGLRKKPNTIAIEDTIKFRSQRSFFPMFLRASDIDKY